MMPPGGPRSPRFPGGPPRSQFRPGFRGPPGARPPFPIRPGGGPPPFIRSSSRKSSLAESEKEAGSIFEKVGSAQPRPQHQPPQPHKPPNHISSCSPQSPSTWSPTHSGSLLTYPGGDDAVGSSLQQQHQQQAENFYDHSKPGGLLPDLQEEYNDHWEESVAVTCEAAASSNSLKSISYGGYESPPLQIPAVPGSTLLLSQIDKTSTTSLLQPPTSSPQLHIADRSNLSYSVKCKSLSFLFLLSLL